MNNYMVAKYALGMDMSSVDLLMGFTFVGVVAIGTVFVVGKSIVVIFRKIKSVTAGRRRH